MRKKYTRQKKKQKKQKKRPSRKEKQTKKQKKQKQKEKQKKQKQKEKQTKKQKKQKQKKQKQKKQKKQKKKQKKTEQLKSGQVTEIRGRGAFRERGRERERESFVAHLRKFGSPTTYQKLNKIQIEKDTIRLPFTTEKKFKPINLSSIDADPDSKNGEYIPYYYNKVKLNDVPKKISHGAYGTVYRYSDELKGYSIAVKDFNTWKSAETEAAIIRRLSEHPLPSAMDVCNMINARVIIYNREEKKLIDLKLYDSIKDAFRRALVMKQEANQLIDEQNELLSKLKKENPRSEKSMAEWKELDDKVGQFIKVLKEKQAEQDAFYNNHDIYVLMDPMDNSLINISRELFQDFREIERGDILMYDLYLNMLKMIAKNIKCLSDKGYYYCDLKPANILYKIFDDKLKIYFGDLGSIFEVDEETERNISPMTYFYKYSVWTHPSPEYYGAQKDGDETDINACLVWSIGATFIELLRRMRETKSHRDPQLTDLLILYSNLMWKRVENRIKYNTKKVDDPVSTYYKDINELLNKIKHLFENILGIQQGGKEYNLWELLTRFFQTPDERITLDEICNLEFNLSETK